MDATFIKKKESSGALDFKKKISQPNWAWTQHSSISWTRVPRTKSTANTCGGWVWCRIFWRSKVEIPGANRVLWIENVKKKFCTLYFEPGLKIWNLCSTGIFLSVVDLIQNSFFKRISFKSRQYIWHRDYICNLFFWFSKFSVHYHSIRVSNSWNGDIVSWF